MNYAADFGLVAFRAVQVVIDGEKMALRQFIGPLNQYAFAAARLDRRAWRIPLNPHWRVGARSRCTRDSNSPIAMR